MAFELEWDHKNLFEGLDRLEAAEAARLEQAAKLVALDGLAEMIEAAPILTGHLRGSHSTFVNTELQATAPPNTDGKPGTPAMRSSGDKKKGKTIILWGCNTVYAARRHENPNAGTRGGGGFWMTKTMNKNMTKWMQFIADKLRELRGSGQ